MGLPQDANSLWGLGLRKIERIAVKRLWLGVAVQNQRGSWRLNAFAFLRYIYLDVPIIQSWPIVTESI